MAILWLRRFANKTCVVSCFFFKKMVKVQAVCLMMLNGSAVHPVPSAKKISLEHVASDVFSQRGEAKTTKTVTPKAPLGPKCLRPKPAGVFNFRRWCANVLSWIIFRFQFLRIGGVAQRFGFLDIFCKICRQCITSQVPAGVLPKA